MSIYMLLAVIGLAVGGVINQLADVLPYRRKQLSGAVCAACGQPRSAIRAIAVVAWIAGKQACPACGRTITVRHVIVELAMAGLFGLLYSQPRFAAEPVLLALAGCHTALLVLVTVTDFEHRLIPNGAILPAIVIAALTSWLWFWRDYWYVALVGGLIGYGFFWIAAALGGKFLGRGAMGGGDVKLAAYVGLITGFPGIITALVVTILTGGIVSMVLLLMRVVNLRSGIPYGPFIALGGLVTMVWGQQIVTRFFFGA